MKKILLIPIALFLFARSALAENLIQNPSFSQKIDLNAKIKPGIWGKYQYLPEENDGDWKQIVSQNGKLEIAATKMEKGALGIRQWIKFPMGKQCVYTLTFTVPEKSNPFFVSVDYIRGEGKTNFRLLGKYLSGNSKTKEYRFYFLSPLDIPADKALLQFSINRLGSFSISSVSLFKGKHVENIIKQDKTVAEFHPQKGRNFSYKAPVKASSELYEFGYPASGAVDGIIGNWGKGGGWNDSTRGLTPDWLEITFPFPEPVWLNEVVVHTTSGKRSCLNEFALQAWIDNSWVEQKHIKNNSQEQIDIIFPKIKTNKIRLLVLKAPSYSRILEVEAYGPPQEVDRIKTNVNFHLNANSKSKLFKSGASSFKVELKNAGDSDEEIELDYRITTPTGKTVSRGTSPIKVPAGKSVKEKIVTELTHGGPYFIIASLKKEGMELKYERLYFGVKGNEEKPEYEYPSEEKLANGELSQGINYKVNLSADFGYPVSPEQCKLAREMGANGIILICHWKYLEPFEGVYDFSWLDKSIQTAAQNGLAVQIWFTYLDRYGPDWLNDYMEDVFNKETGASGGQGHSGVKTVSFFSQRFRESFFRTIKKLIKRYKKNPYVKTWEFSIGRGEAYYPDYSKNYAIFDYSKFAREAFQRYLKEKYSIEKFNSLNKTNIKEWSEVLCPVPLWGEVDLRPIWKDFIEFKMGAVYKFLEETLSFVKSLDPNKEYCINGGGNGPLEGIYRIAEKYNAIPSNCNWEGLVNNLCGSTLKRYNISFRIEGGKVPPEKWNFGALMYNNLKFQIKRYSWVGYLGKDNPAAELYKKQRKAFIEVSGAARYPSSVGVLFSYDTVMCSNFSLLWGSWIWTYEPLFKAVEFSHLPAEWISDYTDLNRTKLDQYKVIIDADSFILKDQLADRLINYVDAGGKFVIGPETGAYSYDSGKKRKYLKKKLSVGTFSLAPPKYKFDFGDVYPYGKGEVLITKKRTISLTVQELKEIGKWADINLDFKIPLECRASLLKKADGSIYMPVFYDDRYYKMKDKSIKTMFQLFNLDDKKSYSIEEYISNSSLGIFSGEELKAGFPFFIRANELLLFKIREVAK